MHSALRLLPGALAVSVLLVGSVTRAAGQATPVATRPTELSAFAELSVEQADYHPTTDAGVVLGASYRWTVPRYISPALEVRGGYVTGSDVSLRTVLGGVRLEPHFRMTHPYHFYGNFLVGRGSINFQHPSRNSDGSYYRSDDSIVFNYGGGVRYDILPEWSVQAEYQRQEWNIGGYPNAIRFHPNGFNVGVVYRFNFRPRHPRS